MRKASQCRIIQVSMKYRLTILCWMLLDCCLWIQQTKLVRGYVSQVIHFYARVSTYSIFFLRVFSILQQTKVWSLPSIVCGGNQFTCDALRFPAKWWLRFFLTFLHHFLHLSMSGSYMTSIFYWNIFPTDSEEDIGLLLYGWKKNTHHFPGLSIASTLLAVGCCFRIDWIHRSLPGMDTNFGVHF